MLKNYFKIAFRNITRNKLFSSINIFGLAAGLAVCLLIMLYIFDELGYDRHQKDADRIYRVAFTGGNGEGWSSQPAPAAWALKTDLPEIEQVTRLLKVPQVDKVLLQDPKAADSRSFFETNGYYVDSTFFQLFTYDFTYGNATTALQQPNSLVISESIASKLFGEANPIGRPVKVGMPFGDFSYTVQGVFKENHKSHIPAHLFLSMRNNDIGKWVDGNISWTNNNIFHTYVKVKAGTDVRVFEQRVSADMARRAGPALKTAGMSRGAFIQPMQDIYLHSSIGNEIAPNGSIKYLYIMGSIAAFVLLIACINFMNLSTARSEKRAREVGVRKVIGAGRGSLIRQFLGESFLLCIMALSAALLLTQVLLPVFNQLTQKDLHLFERPALVLWIAGLTLLTGLLSGLYPALYLSSFRPVKVLKGKIVNSWSATMLRKGLVVFQFTVSVALILGAIVISRQLNFMQNQDLGFKKEQQLILPISGNAADKNYAILKNELAKNPSVASVTAASTYPGIPNINDILGYSEGRTASNFTDIFMATIENDYMETLGVKLLYGRPFSRMGDADSTSIILNQTAIKELGYTEEKAVGRTVSYNWQGTRHIMHIVGVMKDYNFESLHNAVKPLGLNAGNFFANKYTYAIVRLKPGNFAQLLSAVEKIWNKINPATPFQYSFLDQDFQRNYEKEQRTSQMVIYCTAIAIFIACLGLFGLAAFSAEQRTKEIGIRKVLGASVANVTLLLSGDFIRLTLLAIVIASPIAWYGMHKWLQNFNATYRIGISWWMFAAAGGLAVVIALVTVSFQSIKTAIANPAKSLRSE